MPGEQGACDVPVLAVQVQDGYASAYVCQAEQDGGELGQDGGESGAPDTEVQDADERQDEDDVEGAGDGEEHQRCARVADGADDRGEEVEEHQARDTEEADAGERGRLGQELGRGAQQCQRGAGEQAAGDGQDHGHACREDGASGDRASHPLVVAGSERLGGGDGEAGRHAPGEAEQEEQQARGGADGGEGLDAEVAADDDGVGELVELLDDVPDQQGDREDEDDAPGRAGGQDLGHEEGAPGVCCPWGAGLSWARSSEAVPRWWHRLWEGAGGVWCGLSGAG